MKQVYNRCKNIDGLLLIGETNSEERKGRPRNFRGDFFFECKECGKIRHVSSLSNIVNNGRTGLCRPCYVKSIAGISDDKRLLVERIRENGCSLCGYSTYICALSFHHSEPKEKLFGIVGEGTNSAKIPFESFLDEINKCILVCANCHKMLHLKTPPKF